MNRRADYVKRQTSVHKRVWMNHWAVLVMGFAAATLVSPPVVRAIVVFDDFSDGNDTQNPTWFHLDKAVDTSGQKWDATSGAYRLCAPTTPTGNCDPGNATFGSTVPGVEGYDFVGAYVEPSFTDVRVTVDVVDFVPPGFQSSFFAVAARLNGNNDPPMTESGLQLRGYSYQYEGTAANGSGEMVLSIFHGDGIKDVGSFPLTLDPAKDYRVIFEVNGNTIHGQVFEVTDVASGGVVGAMVADQFRDLDANPPSPDNYDGSPDGSDEPFDPAMFASGFSGVYGVGHAFYTDPDFTIDNFRTESIGGGGLLGDYNENGVVDAADYVVWRKNVGTMNNLPNDDIGGTIGSDHYDQWRANFGNPAGGSALGTAVPEPAASTLILLSMLGVQLTRHRQHR
ncbi:MAG TPA: hypothetical protein VGK58_15475 [Lacipirellulaceae bacterium]